MLRRRLSILVALVVLVPATSASAHTVVATITPPTVQPAEDSLIPIVFSGDVSSLRDGDGFISASVRPAGGAPCAPSLQTDPGRYVTFAGDRNEGYIRGAFTSTGTYAAPAPGDYLICAWIKSAYGEPGPPASARITVRSPVLQIAATAPASVLSRTLFPITVDFQAEVPRRLLVTLTPAPDCSVATRAQRSAALIYDYYVVMHDVIVAGVGTLNGDAVAPAPGTHLLCAYLSDVDRSSVENPAPPYVSQLATVAAVPPAPAFQSCGYVGGPRQIRGVRALNMPCQSARFLARRWGSRRRAPLRLGRYKCLARSRHVTCAKGSAKVSFTFGTSESALPRAN